MLKDALRKVHSLVYGPFDSETLILAMHPRKAVYFGVPKVANTSIRTLFAEAAPELIEVRAAALRAGIDPAEFRNAAFRAFLRRKHVMLCKHEAAALRDYYSFAFVRNPWDRLVSCYMNKISGKGGGEEAMHRDTIRTLTRHGSYRAGMSFADFARAVCGIPDSEANRHFRSQHTFLSDRRGRIIPREILRFEDLAGGFARVTQRIGLPQAVLPHKKKTQRETYHVYYDADTAALVEERYRKDVEAFGYAFEG